MSNHADVTEGSGGIWERLHYDWSDPERVVMTTVDSNIWGGASGHTYTFTRYCPTGRRSWTSVVVREGKNLKGRITGLLLGTVGKGVLGKAPEEDDQGGRGPASVRDPITGADGDRALVRAAQTGDVTALALLLEQHRAGMRAVALSILGPVPDADDAVQDAVLVALRRIGDVRDPCAVGAWLRMIVRNRCRSLLRDTQRVVPVGDPMEPREARPPARTSCSNVTRCGTGWRRSTRC